MGPNQVDTATLGFPAGLSGEELAARAALQAQKFGARIKLAARAMFLSSAGGLHQVSFDDGETVQAKSVIIATGAHYNRLPLDRLAEFEGVGVYYAATQAEAQACGTSPAAVVGGGNSAGQAALFLSRSRAEVHMLIRGDSLEASMSRYLIDRITQNPRIMVSPRTRVTALAGTGQLEAVRIRRAARPAESDLAIGGLFVFIGAKPRTGWLAGQLAEDSRGFLLTGTGIPVARLDDENMNPLFLETSRPGIFAVGDVRSGSVKRAAAAIGEGSMAVRLVFDRLQSAGTTDAISSSAPAHVALSLDSRGANPVEAEPSGERRLQPRPGQMPGGYSAGHKKTSTGTRRRITRPPPGITGSQPPRACGPRMRFAAARRAHSRRPVEVRRSALVSHTEGAPARAQELSGNRG